MRSTSDKIRIFKGLFTGLKQVYGTYDPLSGKARQVKEPVTEKVFLAHLSGRQPYGVYLLVKDRTGAVAADFDTVDRLPPFEFVSAANHYGIEAYIERSKSKGYHVWVFLENQGVCARKARAVVHHILEEIEHRNVEVFPKQDILDTRNRYGNFINAPLFGALVPKNKTVFVDPATFEPYPDQWDLLDSVEKSTESLLDEIIEINSVPTSIYLHHSSQPDAAQSEAFPLPPCARKMLQDGVVDFQRVSCFRLAVHFRRIGIPVDITEAALRQWSKKNRPRNDNRKITPHEVSSQTFYAYKHDYRGFGCAHEAIKLFCSADCPVHQ